MVYDMILGKRKVGRDQKNKKCTKDEGGYSRERTFEKGTRSGIEDRMSKKSRVESVMKGVLRKDQRTRSVFRDFVEYHNLQS